LKFKSLSALNAAQKVDETNPRLKDEATTRRQNSLFNLSIPLFWLLRPFLIQPVQAIKPFTDGALSWSKLETTFEQSSGRESNMLLAIVRLGEFENRQT
jgi:hypothetical protein